MSKHGAPILFPCLSKLRLVDDGAADTVCYIDAPGLKELETVSLGFYGGPLDKVLRGPSQAWVRDREVTSPRLEVLRIRAGSVWETTTRYLCGTIKTHPEALGQLRTLELDTITIDFSEHMYRGWVRFRSDEDQLGDEDEEKELEGESDQTLTDGYDQDAIEEDRRHLNSFQYKPSCDRRAHHTSHLPSPCPDCLAAGTTPRRPRRLLRAYLPPPSSAYPRRRFLG